MPTTHEWKMPLPQLQETKPKNWYERFYAFGDKYLLLILIIGYLMMSSESVVYILAAIAALLTIYRAIMPRLAILCRISSRGMVQRQGVITMGRKRWSEIEGFRVMASEVPNLGVVIITANKRNQPSPMCLFFDDREVSPEQMRAALLQHLAPEKELS